MTGRAELLDLSAGSGLRLDGAEWTVEAVQPQFGRVLLRAADGDLQWRTIRWLVHHRDCRRVAGAAPGAAAAVRQPPAWVI